MIAQVLRFAGIGAVATGVHVIVALLAVSLLGAAPHVGNLAGFVCAVSVSYFGHGRITFGTQLAHHLHLPRFIVTSCAGLLVSTLLVQLLAVHLKLPFALAIGAVAVAVPAATFVLCKVWVFSEPQSKGP